MGRHWAIPPGCVTVPIIAVAACFVMSNVFAEEVIELDVDLGEELELGADAIEIVEEDAPAAPAAAETGGGDDVEIEIVEGELEKMPEIVEFVEAEYPESFVRDGIEGSVIFELLVSETGAVDSISVVRSLNPELDTSAMAAVRKFRFSPAIADGEAVAVMLQYEYRFSLREVVTVPESYVNYSGRLLERGTRRPVADALVVLTVKEAADDGSLGMPFELYMEQIGKIEGQEWEDGHLVTATDSLGYFRFRSIPTCKVELRVQSPDHEPYATWEDINRLEEVSGVYYVGRLDYSEYELVVYGKVEEKEVSRRQISIAEIKRIPGFGGEALRVVEAMPGVGRPSFGGTEVVVRGSPSWASRYFIDGMYVPILYHMGSSTSRSTYPSEAVEAVDFYPGGFSARYGSATTGVIEMRSRKSKTDRLQGYVDLSNLDGALFVEGPISERVSFMASGRRGFVGDLLKFVFEKYDPTGVGIVAAPFYWDFLLRTDVKIDNSNDLFVKLIGSRDSLGVYMPTNFGMTSSSEIDAAVGQLNVMFQFYTLIAGLDSRFGDRWKNSLRLSAFMMEQRMSMLGMMKMDQPLQGAHVRNEVSYKANDKVTINAGVDVELWNVDMNITMITGQNVVGTMSFDDNKYGKIGGYATVEWKPIDNLLLVPGIRYDYYPELDYKGSIVPAFWDYGIINNRRGASGEPALRVSGRYEYKDGHVAKAAMGTYSQSPEPFGMAVHEVVGEPDLPATKAAQYVVGYEWQINDLINLDVQGYYNNMWDVARFYDARIDYDPSRQIQRNMFSDGLGRTYGMELMLRHNRSDKFFGWVSYTLSRSEEWSKVDGKYVLSSRDEPHHLQLLGSWKLKNNWEIGTRTRFVSGKPTSKIIGTVEDEINKSISAVYEEGRSERLDPFFQVDIRVDKKFVYNKWMLTYYLDLQNVLWPLYKSSEFEYYNYNYTQKQKIAMIPMIAGGVRAEF